MTTTTTSSAGLTSYSRFVLFGLVLPLLFIAGVQLFILSAQTATYFAWTFASPLAAAFMGAGYWSAMFHAYSGGRAKGWEYVRSSMPAALTATTLLTLTTFLQLFDSSTLCRRCNFVRYENSTIRHWTHSAEPSRSDVQPVSRELCHEPGDRSRVAWAGIGDRG